MSGNPRLPSSKPEAFLPLLSLSALLVGLGALLGDLLDEPPPAPARTLGENAYLGAPGDSPEVVNGYAVLVNRQDCQELEKSWRSHFGYPLVLQDEDRTLWAEAGTTVEVVDASHPSFTGVRILEGTHAGKTGWVWLGHVLRATRR